MRRQYLTYLLGFILTLTVVSAAPTAANQAAAVLMYHRFGEDRFPATNIRTEQFKAQLDFLKKNGFPVVSLSSLLDALTGGKPLPASAVVITIDDAYRSVYQVAYPIFKEYGFPFTVFVATDPVDKGLPAYMTWEQMRAMAGGGASFANHGAGHLSMITTLKGESDDARVSRVLADVEKGRRRLAEELALLPGVFAYPYGEYDGRVAEQLKKMGYICFGQHAGAVGPQSDRRALPRFAVSEAYADISDFSVKVKSLPMPVEAVTPWEPVVSESRPEIEITLGAAGARLPELACYISGQGRAPVRWVEVGKRFKVTPQRPLGPGRQHVNCTAPRNDGRYLWYSHPWFVQISR